MTDSMPDQSNDSLLQPLLPWTQRRWFWIVLAVAVFSPFIDTEPGQGNVASDLAAIESLAERHTFFINDSPFVNTIDKFKRGDKFFSQKSPIFHLAAAIPSGILTLAGYHLADHVPLHLRVLTLLLVILPMGWLLGLIYSHPWLSGCRPLPRFALTLAFGFGSLLTPFCVTLNHYIPASAFMLMAMRCCLTKEGAFDIPSLSAGLKIGFWISASFACDIPPAFIIGVSFAVWVAVRAMIHSARWAAFAGFVFGVLPLIICYAALNFHILGSPLPPNMHESEMLLYKGSFWAEQKARSDRGDPGYYEASYSRRIFHSTLGHKGIYWMMPLISWATIAALARAWRNRRERVPLTALALFPPLTVLVVMRWAIDLSGGAYGIRHVFATLPPLYCVLGLSLSGLKKGALTRAIFLATGIWGGAIAWIGVINPWSHNTLSPIPPLENLARLSLKHPGDYPTGWIEGLIESTSVDLQTSWLDLGLEHLAGKRPDKAEVSLKHAVLAKPSAALPYYHLGIALDMQRKSAEAIEVYEKLLSLEPNNLGGWNNIGIFALHARKIDLAKRAFEKSLTLAPGNATGLWGSLIIDQFEGAVNPNSPKLTEALSRHPDDPRIQALAKSWGRGLDPDPLIEKSPAHSAK